MPEDQSQVSATSDRSVAAAWLLGCYLVFVAAVACWMLLLLFPVSCVPGEKGVSGCPETHSVSGAAPPAPSAAPPNSASGAPASVASVAPSASVAAVAPAPSGSGAAAAPAPSATPSPTPAAAGNAAASQPQVIVVAAPATPKAQLVFGRFYHLGFEIDIRGNDEGLLLLALLAGVLGSFMHAGQSLAMYVGNGQLKASWLLWYMLRPAIGGVLGLLFYFFLRAGLIPAAGSSATESVSPYGVVAFGALAGWFSKRATDKLAEIFETLFRTAKDQEYRDPLSKDGKPEIQSVDPAKISIAQVPATGAKLVVTCDKLAAQAWLNIDGVKQATTSEGGMKLSCVVPVASLKASQPLKVTVSNPPSANAAPGSKPTVSEPFSVPVEA